MNRELNQHFFPLSSTELILLNIRLIFSKEEAFCILRLLIIYCGTKNKSIVSMWTKGIKTGILFLRSFMLRSFISFLFSSNKEI